VVKMNINLHSPLEMKGLYSSLPLHFKQGMEVYIRLYHFISSREWRFIFIFTKSFQAGNGGLYSSLPLHFKQRMEVYIRLYHYISSGEWKYIFIFTTSFQAGNGGLYSSLPLTFQAVNGDLYSSLPLHFKRGMEVYIHLYHFISSREWRFIFIFTTYISSGEWRFIFVFKVVKKKINLHYPLEMK
jgi:hypothetical protein